MSTPSPIPFLPALTEISGLRTRFFTVGPALHQAKRALLDVQDQENEATRLVAERKAELEYLVINDLDSSGKPRYSNDAARKAALAKALGEDADYQDMNKRLRLFTTERQRSGLEVERIESEMKALRAVADLHCAEALLLFGGSR